MYPMNQTDFLVAAGRFARNGLVVEFRGKVSANSFFDCPFWSDFADEDEKLFIGGAVGFAFATIRNIKTRQNYGVYIKAISMFHMIVQGYPWNAERGIIGKKYRAALNRLIEAEIAQKIVLGESSMVPDYVLFLWHNLVAQVKHCEICWFLMIENELNIGFPALSYKPLTPLFCNENMTAPDFGVFTTLLPNMETMSVYMDPEFKKSISLTPLTVSNLLDSLSTHSKIEKIDIVNATCDITEFVTLNKEQFEAIGWSLSRKMFKHRLYGECESNLCIERM